jgi:riboflavin synthase alpha subunit
MFTGIIETLGVIQEIKENSNIHITMLLLQVTMIEEA